MGNEHSAARANSRTRNSGIVHQLFEVQDHIQARVTSLAKPISQLSSPVTTRALLASTFHRVKIAPQSKPTALLPVLHCLLTVNQSAQQLCVYLFAYISPDRENIGVSVGEN